MVRAPLLWPPTLVDRRPPPAATRQRANVEHKELLVRAPLLRPPNLVARRLPSAATRQRTCVEEKQLVVRVPPLRPPTLVARRSLPAVARQQAGAAAEVLMVRAPPPRPPALSVCLRLRKVDSQPQDRPLMPPPRRPQLPVRRLCRKLPWFLAARNPRRVLFCSSCGRARPAQIELSCSLFETIWRPISSLIAGPFWSRICSVQRFFFAIMCFFFPHTLARRRTPPRRPWIAKTLGRPPFYLGRRTRPPLYLA